MEGPRHERTVQPGLHLSGRPGHVAISHAETSTRRERESTAKGIDWPRWNVAAGGTGSGPNIRPLRSFEGPHRTSTNPENHAARRPSGQLTHVRRTHACTTGQDTDRRRHPGG